MGKTAKLTISLPQELILFADEIAKERKISRSKVFSACLQELVEKQRVAKMTEGYQRLAKEQKKFADMASSTMHEIVPEWK